MTAHEREQATIFRADSSTGETLLLVGDSVPKHLQHMLSDLGRMKSAGQIGLEADGG
jgi:hypothetical protein